MQDKLAHIGTYVYAYTCAYIFKPYCKGYFYLAIIILHGEAYCEFIF